jgi:hypothetical protein
VTALARLCEALRRGAGDALSAVVVYGAATRGAREAPGEELNVLVVLREITPAALGAIAAPLNEARRRAGIRPYLAAADELPRLADVFPIKVLEIQRYHEVLEGDDPLPGLEVDGEHLRLRVEQQLRNHLLRLRRGYVEAEGDSGSLEALLRSAVRPLRTELEALMIASGEQVAPGPRAAIFEHAARVLDLDVRTLDELHRLPGAPADDPADLAARALELLAQATRLADRLEVRR